LRLAIHRSDCENFQPKSMICIRRVADADRNLPRGRTGVWGHPPQNYGSWRRNENMRIQVRLFAVAAVFVLAVTVSRATVGTMQT